MVSYHATVTGWCVGLGTNGHRNIQYGQTSVILLIHSSPWGDEILVVGDRTDKESHTINAMIGSTFVCGWSFFCVPGEYEAEICFVWKNSCGSLFKCFFFFSMFVVLIDYTFMFMTCHKGGSLAHKRYNCLFKSAGRQQLNSGPLPLLFLPVTFSCLAIQVKYTNT